MSRAAGIAPVPETALVGLAMATVLSGFRPYEIRKFVHPDPETGDAPLVRSAIVDGQRLVRLDDVMQIANALAEGSPS